jgi:Formin Homology 2 Domain/Diaphanous GTPase-binding Domain/Diaphanous FH3 Domain
MSFEKLEQSTMLVRNFHLFPTIDAFIARALPPPLVNIQIQPATHPQIGGIFYIPPAEICGSTCTALILTQRLKKNFPSFVIFRGKMASKDARIARLQREIRQLEEDLERIEDRIELTEIRMLRAKGNAEDEAEVERRLEELDEQFDEKDVQVEVKRKELARLQSGEGDEEFEQMEAERVLKLAEKKAQEEAEKTEALKREQVERQIVAEKQAAAAEKLKRAQQASLSSMAAVSETPLKKLDRKSDDDEEDDEYDESDDEDVDKESSQLGVQRDISELVLSPSKAETKSEETESEKDDDDDAAPASEVPKLALETANKGKEGNKSKRRMTLGATLGLGSPHEPKSPKAKKSARRKSAKLGGGGIGGAAPKEADADTPSKKEERRKKKDEKKLAKKAKKVPGTPKEKRGLFGKKRKTSTPTTASAAHLLSPVAIPLEEQSKLSESATTAAAVPGSAADRDRVAQLQAKSKERLLKSTLRTSSATLTRLMAEQRAAQQQQQQLGGGGPAASGVPELHLPADAVARQQWLEANEEPLNKTFDMFLDSMKISSAKERQLWHAQYSLEAKAQLIQALSRDGKLTMMLQDEINPEYYVHLLRSNTNDLDALKKLRLKLETANAAWIDQYVRLNGVQWLCEALDFALYKATKTSDLPAPSAKEGAVGQLAERERALAKVTQKLEILLGCLVRLVDQGSVGPDELALHVATVRSIVFTVRFVPLAKKTGICELLAAICIMSERTWELVVEAVGRFACSGDAFAALLTELDGGDDLDFKSAFMSLINTMIVRGESAADRVRVRGIFVDAGLIAIVERIKDLYPDDSLQQMIEVFEDEMESDMAELGIDVASIASSGIGLDVDDEASALCARIRGADKDADAETSLAKTLVALNRVADNGDLDAVWPLVEQFAEHTAALFDADGDNARDHADALSYSDLLLELLARAGKADGDERSLLTASASSARRLARSDAANCDADALRDAAKKSAERAANMAAQVDALEQRVKALQAELDARPEKIVEKEKIVVVEKAAAGGAAAESSNDDGEKPPAAEKPADDPAPIDAAAPPPPPPPPPPPGGAAGPPPPPPPPPPGGGAGPPPPPPPPGGGPPGPPPPPGAPGGFGAPTPTWHDPSRPAMVQWRWNLLRGPAANGTIFVEMKPCDVEFDKDLLSKVFQAPPKGGASRFGGAKNSNGGGDEFGAAASSSGGAEKAAPEVVQPRFLNQQRCTVVELVMKKFGVPVETLKHSIVSANTEILDIDTLVALSSLFPAKSYDMELKQLVTTFEGDPQTLSRPEYFLHTLLTVPDIRTKIANLTLGLEVPPRLEQTKEKAEAIKSTLAQLKADKIKRFIELLFGIGVYMNNPKGMPPRGFKFSSLLKLKDTKTRVPSEYTQGKSTTLLHFVVDMLERQESELLGWVDDAPLLSSAANTADAFMADMAYLGKARIQLQRSIKQLDDAGAEQAEQFAAMRAYFERTHALVEAEFEALEVVVEQLKADIKYFGETDANEPAEFFRNWHSLASAFQAAIKFNAARRKKEEAARAREAKLRAKQQEDQIMRKVVTTMRCSQANIRDMAQGGERKLDPFLRGPPSARRSAGSPPPSPSSAPPTVDAKAQAAVDSIMANILADAPSSSATDSASAAASDSASSSSPSSTSMARRRRRRGGDNPDSGVVSSVGRTLRTRDAYNTLRQSRSKRSALPSEFLDSNEATSDASASSSSAADPSADSSAAANMEPPSSIDVSKPKTRAEKIAARRALARQVSKRLPKF